MPSAKMACCQASRVGRLSRFRNTSRLTDISLSLVIPLPYIHKMPRHCGGGGHCRRDEVCAASLALAAFEVAVAGACAPLARLQLVGVHRQAHRAARLAPLEARLLEDPVESFFLGLLLHLPAAGNDHRVDTARDVIALHY